MKYAAIILVLHACRCYGHGKPIIVNVASAALTASGGLMDDRGYAESVFADSDEEAVFFPAPGDRLAATLPGLNVFDMGAGQQISLEVLARPDFTKAAAAGRWLWYWDPAAQAVVDVPQNAKLEIGSSRGLGSINLLQSVAPPRATVKAADLLLTDIGEHRHVFTYLLDNASAPAGPYGFFARLTSPDFQPSDPFLIALNNGLDPATFQKGAKHINAAARLPGDYDGDEDNDGSDFLLWQRTLGSTTSLAADGSLNDVIDADDLGVWKGGFGSITFGRVVSIPEPPIKTVTLGVLALVLIKGGRLKC